MESYVKKIIFLFLSSLTVSFSSMADDQSPLGSQMDAYVIEIKDGKEVRKPAKEVYPEDQIEYELTYTNKSDNQLSGLVITGPIPVNTVYLGNTNKTLIDSDFVVSVDGGKTFESEPVKREIIKDGKKIEVIVPPEKYTAVRWVPKRPIDPMEKQVFTYRIEVE